MKKSNFEKKIKSTINSKGNFSSIIGRIDNDFQHKNIYMAKKNKIVKFIPFISIGSVILEAAIILLVVSLTNNSIWNKASSHNHDASSDTTSGGSSIPSSRENQRTYRHYECFDFGARRYKCSNEDFNYIDQNLIKKQIGELDIEQTDTLEGIDKTKHILIYEILNTNPSFGIGVKFAEESGYFLYTSSSLDYGVTLNAFMEGMNFEENVCYSFLSYSYENGGSIKTITTDNVGSSISNLLDNNLIKTNVYSSDESSPYHNFSTEISAKIILKPLGNVVFTFDINLDGRSRFSIVDENTFLIEPEDVLSLKNYIIENGK